MVMFYNFIFIAIIGAAITVTMSEVAFFVVSKAQRRRQDLERARVMFEQHFRMRDALVADHRVPSTVKDFVEEASHDFEQRNFGELVAIACDDEGELANGPVPEFADAFERLRRSHPDLAEDAYRCIYVGIFATLLRWPGTSDRAGYLMSRFVAAPRASVVKAVASLERKSIRHHEPHPIPMPAE